MTNRIKLLWMAVIIILCSQIYYQHWRRHTPLIEEPWESLSLETSSKNGRWTVVTTTSQPQKMETLRNIVIKSNSWEYIEGLWPEKLVHCHTRSGQDCWIAFHKNIVLWFPPGARFDPNNPLQRTLSSQEKEGILGVFDDFGL